METKLINPRKSNVFSQKQSKTGIHFKFVCTLLLETENFRYIQNTYINFLNVFF